MYKFEQIPIVPLGVVPDTFLAHPAREVVLKYVRARHTTPGHYELWLNPKKVPLDDLTSIKRIIVKCVDCGSPVFAFRERDHNRPSRIKETKYRDTLHYSPSCLIAPHHLYPEMPFDAGCSKGDPASDHYVWLKTQLDDTPPFLALRESRITATLSMLQRAHVAVTGTPADATVLAVWDHMQAETRQRRRKSKETQ